MSLLDVEIPEPETREVTVCTCPICHQAFIRREEYERHYPRCKVEDCLGMYVTWMCRDHWRKTETRCYGRVVAALGVETATDYDLEAYETCSPSVHVIGVAETLNEYGDVDVREEELDPGEVEECPKERVKQAVRKACALKMDLMKEVVG